MVTVDEETQAKEFLKRAEIRTMKKDLLALREADSMKERRKIIGIKTLEEQMEEKRKAELDVPVKAVVEKAKREEVLQKNEGQEKIAEKDLKNYATEEERQQIFLLESQRLALEKQTDAIDKEKDPALKLEKNKILLEKRNWEEKANSIKQDSEKMDTEENFLIEKTGQSQIPAEKKGLEQRRAEIEDQRKGIEKKEWEAEKQLKDIDSKISNIDKSSAQLVAEKNGLRDKILGIDKSLREIYSAVMQREEEKRIGKSQEQMAEREVFSKAKSEQNEKTQRQQWSGNSQAENDIPIPTRKNPVKSFVAENEQRKKFMQDVEQASQMSGTQQQKSNINK